MSFIKKRITFLLISITISAIPQSTHAIWWWFDGDDYDNLSLEEQNKRAEPLYEEGMKLFKEGRYSKARGRFKTVWKEYTVSKHAADSLFHTAKIDIIDHDWEDAHKSLQRLVLYYPNFPHFNEIIKMQFEIATALENGDNVYWLWVIPSRERSEAIRIYNDIVINAPYSEYAPVSLMRIALLNQAEGNTMVAVQALDRLINNYPNSMLTSDAYLRMAQTFSDLVKGISYDQSATQEAISYFQDYLILYPDSPVIAEGERGLDEHRNILAKSKLEMGQFYFHYRDNFEAAEIYFNEAITIDPESEAANEARDYLVDIEQVLAAYPEGNYPKRTAWAYFKFWDNYDPVEDLPAVAARERQPATTDEPEEEKDTEGEIPLDPNEGVFQ